jgi:TP901 family phage tail tape measure protein
MAEASLGKAYVNLVPGFKDFKASFEKGVSTELNGAGDKTSKAFGSSFVSGLKKFAGPIAAAISVTAITNFAKEGVKAAQQVSSGLREVVTLTGLTGSEADAAFEDFRKGVSGLSTELGIAQDVLINGLYNALSAGVPKDNVFDFMEVASRAAIAGVTDTNTAVDGITTVLNGFSLSADQASAVADSMFQAVKGGKTTFAELSASLFNAGPAAAAAGVSFQEVNAAIATLTAAGVPTSVATTQIRAALVGLQRPSEDLDAIFKSLGYENAQVAIQAKGLGFALDAVKEASGGNNGALQQLLGSVEAVGAANIIAGTGAEKYAAELEAQANAVGATDAAFNEIDKSRSMERLGIIFKNLGIQVGTILLPLIEDIARALSEWLQSSQPQIDAFTESFKKGETPLNDFFKVLTDSLKFLLENFNVIVTVGGAIGALVATIKTLTAIVNIAKAATALFNLVLAANPYVLLATAVALLVAGLVYFFTQTEVGKQAWAAFTQFLTDAFNNVITFFQTAFTNVSTFLKNMVDGIFTTFSNVFTNIGNFFKGIINTYIGFWEGFINFFINGINLIVNGINSIKINVPDWLQGLTGGAKSIGFNIPNLANVSLPRLADGGVVMPRNGGVLAQIAEAGQPEAVIPLDKLDEITGGTGGDTYIYNAAENRSLSTEEEFVKAAKRTRLQVVR